MGHSFHSYVIYYQRLIFTVGGVPNFETQPALQVLPGVPHQHDDLSKQAGPQLNTQVAVAWPVRECCQDTHRFGRHHHVFVSCSEARCQTWQENQEMVQCNCVLDL